MVEIFRRTQNIIVSCYVLLVVHIEALGSNEDFPHYPKLKLSSVNYKNKTVPRLVSIVTRRYQSIIMRTISVT